MATVFKYSKSLLELAVSNIMEFDIPVGSELLSVREQGNRVCLWFAVEQHNKQERRRFEVVGTGKSAPTLEHNANTDDWDIIGEPLGSCHFDNGSLVLHVFELVNQK